LTIDLFLIMPCRKLINSCRKLIHIRCIFRIEYIYFIFMHWNRFINKHPGICVLASTYHL
jgi:hypothetical protein